MNYPAYFRSRKALASAQAHYDAMQPLECGEDEIIDDEDELEKPILGEE